MALSLMSSAEAQVKKRWKTVSEQRQDQKVIKRGRGKGGDEGGEGGTHSQGRQRHQQ